MTAPTPIRPLPINDRASMLFIERGQVDVEDGCFVVIDQTGTRTQIPLAGLACIMLEPGTRISHRAVALAADTRTLLVWVGEAGVRVYSSGAMGSARSDRLLYQAKLALDETTRLAVARRMYALRFGEEAPERRSVDQLRGIEGARVRAMYELFARKHGVAWQGRRYDPAQWDSADVANRCLSSATSCLYGVTEAAVLAAGYSPSIGFIHSGKPLSFVYDIADIYKFETVVPAAFRIAASQPANPERAVRLACRDAFRSTKLLERIIPDIDKILSSTGVVPPEAPFWTVPPAILQEADL